MKKIISLVLALLMLTSLASCGAGTASSTAASTSASPAQYSVVADGRNGDIAMTVTLEGSTITAVEIKEHSETAGIADAAIETMPSRIVEAQSLAVDTVAGATITSEAILSGVEKALLAAGLDPSAYKAAANAELTQGQTEETDVVIVGAGMAGLMAAYELKEDHPDVSFIVVEKLDMLTGSIPGTGGAIIATTSVLHSADGHECTVQDIIDLFEYTSGTQINRALVSNVYADSDEVLDRLQGYGTNFQSPQPSSKYSSKVYAYWHENRGQGLAAVLNTYIDANSFDLRLSTTAESLIVEDGRVAGIHVSDRTQEYDIRAKAVILATGGFGSSNEYMEQYLPAFADGYFSTNAGATGDGIAMTAQFGTKVVGEGSMGSIVAPDGSDLIASYFIVNQNGERFIGEGEPKYVVQRAVSQQPDQAAYLLADASYADTDTLNSKIEKGYVKQYDTLEELAKDNGLDTDTLLATVAAYNAAADAGEDIPAAEYALSASLATKIETAPFYIEKAVLRTFGTIPGIEVNENCQVLTGSGDVVEGLYAVGELIAGNAFTRQYPGAGVGISWAANTGRYAAELAAASLAG